MRRVLSYMLIILFSFQVIPVKELGKLLLKKAATEQTADLDEDAGSACKKKAEEGTEPVLNETVIRLNQILSNRQALTALHHRCIIPPHFVPEIATPPPNRC